MLLLITVTQSHAGIAKSVRDSLPEEEQSKKYDGMFALYQANREHGVGNFITADFVLNTYNLAMRKTVSDLEESEILPLLHNLINRLQNGVEKSPPDRKGRTVALGYLSLIKCLLDPTAVPPEEVAAKVKAELELIEKHASLSTSPLLGVREDYSQYLPRGKYTRSPAMESYFRAMMYTGRQGFMVRASEATGVNQELADRHMEAALFLAGILADDQEAYRATLRIDQLLTLLVGKSDDLSLSDVTHVPIAAGASLPETEPAKYRGMLIEWAKSNGRIPKIVGGIVEKEKLEKGVTPQEAVQAIKLIGQRYTPDSDVLQGMVYDSVLKYKGDGKPFTLSVVAGKPVRGVPTILDLMAALGSGQSKVMLTARDDNNYEGYQQQIVKAGNILRSEAYNPDTLAAVNLRLAYRLAQADSGERLNAAIGSWIQNRHATMLYAKQSYTLVGKSLQKTPAYPNRSHAAVEVAPELYSEIIEAFLNLSDKLENAQIRKNLSGLTSLIRNLRRISHLQSENPGEWVNNADMEFLNNFDLKAKAFIGDADGPITVDIHTDANSGTVLQEAIGAPVAVWTESKIRGARYSVFEFRQPMDKRLTDEAWSARVKAGETGSSLTGQITGRN